VFQDEKQFSAACLIAHLYRPNFNGTLEYDADSRFPRDDVEVFAHGLRNSYDVSEMRYYFAGNGPKQRTHTSEHYLCVCFAGGLS
jgi:hypothetical protein